MRWRVIGLIFTCMALSLTSCATMIRGTTEELQLSSNPAGAKATLSNGQSCIAPCSLNLPRNASVAVTFSKEHCDNQLVSVFPVLAGAGVILGGLIDYGTGAVYSLQPNPVVVGLKCAGVPEAAVATMSTAPQCRDPEVRARCPLFQVRAGVYRGKCQDGSGVEAGLGYLRVTPPPVEHPHPWDAEGCTLAVIGPQS